MRRRGSSASRSPSPRKLSASTVTKIERPGERRVPGRLAEQVPPEGEHGAPGGIRRLDPEPEERERGLDEDRVGHGERALDDQRREAVGQDDAGRDVDAASPQRPRGLDELLLADRQGVGARDAGEGRDEHDSDRHHGVLERWPEDGHQRDGQQDRREGQQGVHEAHDEAVEPAADVPGQETQRDAHGGGDPHRDRADHERGARPVHDPAQDVAPQVVRAQPVAGGRREEAVDGMDLVGPIRRDPGGEDGEQGEDAGQPEPERRRAAPEQAPEDRHRMPLSPGTRTGSAGRGTGTGDPPRS